MAEKTEDNKKEKVKAEGKKTAFRVRFAYFMLFVTALVFLPSTIVFSVCMVPTLVAAIIDNNPQRTAWLTIGAMNLAGTVPVWFNLWDAGHTPQAAFQLVTQPTTILISYGGACVGWLIYTNITPFIAAIVLNKNERRVKEIHKQQQAMVKKWGDSVKLD